MSDHQRTARALDKDGAWSEEEIANIAAALEAAEKRGRVAGLREADEMNYQTHIRTCHRIDEVERA